MSWLTCQTGRARRCAARAALPARFRSSGHRRRCWCRPSATVPQGRATGSRAPCASDKAIVAAQAKFGFVVADRRATRPTARRARAVVRVHHLDPLVAVQRSRLGAAIVVDLLVEPVGQAIGPRRPDMVRHRLRHAVLNCASLGSKPASARTRSICAHDRSVTSVSTASSSADQTRGARWWTAISAVSRPSLTSGMQIVAAMPML